jgi:hypothetical protein
VAAPSPVTSAASPPSSPAASPSASAPPSAPLVLGCEPRRPVAVPSLFRALFEKGRRFTYAVRDDVDPHGEDGRSVVTKLQVTCEVRTLRRFRDAVGSEIACTTPGPGSILPSDQLVFLASPSALWMVSALPLDEATVATHLKESPLLVAVPVNVSRSRDEPGMFEGQVDHCVDAVEAGAAVVCRDIRCDVAQGYGPTQARQCVSAARGLESWVMVNLAGPRTTSWKLVATMAPRAGAAGGGAEGEVPLCAE